MHRLIIILFTISCFFSNMSFGQHKPKEGHFIHPLKVPLVLSGTFGELRSNHFHSGIDIKTQQREGLEVVASASGRVSRIKIQRYGYGKALYLEHENGYTTVYAHLKRFSDIIEAYVKKQQYAKETYTIELFPKNEGLYFNQGDVIGYSGNSGSSGGPHLHFEIRDASERPMNPLLFGFDVKDTRKPLIQNVFAYAISDSAHVNQSQKKVKLKLYPQKEGGFKTNEVSAYGTIGFGIETVDRLDGAYNKNGVYNICTDYNGEKLFELDFSKFSFSETRYINRLIDYSHFKEERKRVQKLFKEQNNPLSILKNHNNNGFINVDDDLNGIYKIKVSDLEGNINTVSIPIKGTKDSIIHKDSICKTPHYIYHDQPYNFDENNISVYIPKHALYEDQYLNIEVSGDTISLHNDKVPLHKNITVKFDVSHYNAKDKEKLFISYLGYKNTPQYEKTYKKNNVFSTRTRALGKYTLTIDNDPPKITPVNFRDKKWLSNYKYLKVKITDDLSGIKNYRATINGKFILMEYDYKKDLLVYNFDDNINTETENNLKVIVTDNVGNSSTFESVFYRKVKTQTIESTN